MKKNLIIILVTIFVAALCALCVTACRGEKGNNGADGADGVNITGAFVEDGDLYLVLSNGEYVNCGTVVGSDGEDGEDGIDGIGIVDITYNKDGELLIKFANGEVRNIGISPKVCAHKYPEEWVVETVANCVSQGYRYKTCSECGFIKSEITPATGHDWDEENAQTVIKRETCTDCGWQTVICKTCQDSKMVELKPTTHFYQSVHIASEGRYVKECRNCQMRKPSEGLEYKLVNDSYQLTGLGTCTDTDIVISDVVETENGLIPVTKITPGVFTGQDITSVYISKNVNSIDVSTGSLFGNEYCENMNNITIHAKNTTYRSDGNCIIDIQNKSVVAGCAASAIPSDGSVTTIGQNAFNGVVRLLKIVIPDKVVTLGAMAFAYCAGITQLTLGGSLTTIGSDCFSNCNNLETVKINNVPSIGQRAFAFCNNLKEVWLNNGCYRVGVQAFSCCKSLKTVHISSTVKGIAKYAFGGCESLDDLRFGGTRKEWWDVSMGVGVADEDWNKTPLIYQGIYNDTPIDNDGVKYSST